MSLPERYNHYLESKDSQNGSTDTQKTKAHYTICDKMSNSGNKSIVEYLFEEGKCGDICRQGNNFLLFFTFIRSPFIIYVSDDFFYF